MTGNFSISRIQKVGDALKHPPKEVGEYRKSLTLLSLVARQTEETELHEY